MPSPKTILQAHQLHPKQQLGQNFLSDPSTAAMIVSRADLSAEDTVLEIGAGLGALTIPAARMARKVYALETDRRLLPFLEQELSRQGLGNVTVLHRDILGFDFPEFAETEGLRDRLKVIGNLPYHISSQILVRLIGARAFIQAAWVMFQKELADRLAAPVGGKDYGRLTVMLRYCAEIKPVAAVPARMFYPKPKVDSEVLEIRFTETPVHPASDEAFLFSVIKAAFSKRRKTLKNALATSELALGPNRAASALAAAGIEPIRRAETLSVKEFVDLSHAVRSVMPTVIG